MRPRRDGTGRAACFRSRQDMEFVKAMAIALGILAALLMIAVGLAYAFVAFAEAIGWWEAIFVLVVLIWVATSKP